MDGVTSIPQFAQYFCTMGADGHCGEDGLNHGREEFVDLFNGSIEGFFDMERRANHLLIEIFLRLLQPEVIQTIVIPSQDTINIESKNQIRDWSTPPFSNI